jgi:hypothetical protein
MRFQVSLFSKIYIVKFYAMLTCTCAFYVRNKMVSCKHISLIKRSNYIKQTKIENLELGVKVKFLNVLYIISILIVQNLIFNMIIIEK